MFSEKIAVELAGIHINIILQKYIKMVEKNNIKKKGCRLKDGN